MRGALAHTAPVVARKTSAKSGPHQVDMSHFPRFLMFQMLPFAGSLRKLATCKVESSYQFGCSYGAVRRSHALRNVGRRHLRISCELKRDHALCLVAETLLMATLLHALAALVLGNFRFASFFERAHSGFSDSRAGIQPSNPARCNLLLCYHSCGHK